MIHLTLNNNKNPGHIKGKAKCEETNKMTNPDSDTIAILELLKLCIEKNMLGVLNGTMDNMQE